MTGLEKAAAIAGIVGAALTLAAFLVAWLSVKNSGRATEAADRAAAHAEEAAAINARERWRERLIEIGLQLAEYRQPYTVMGNSIGPAQAIRIRLLVLAAADTDLLPCTWALANETITEQDGQELVSYEPPEGPVLDAAIKEVLGLLSQIPPA